MKTNVNNVNSNRYHLGMALSKLRRYELFASRSRPRLLLGLGLGPNNDIEQKKDSVSFWNSEITRDQTETKPRQNQWRLIQSNKFLFFHTTSLKTNSTL